MFSFLMIYCRAMVGWPSNDAFKMKLKLCGDVRIDDVMVKDSTQHDRIAMKSYGKLNSPAA